MHTFTYTRKKEDSLKFTLNKKFIFAFFLFAALFRARCYAAPFISSASQEKSISNFDSNTWMESSRTNDRLCINNGFFPCSVNGRAERGSGCYTQKIVAFFCEYHRYWFSQFDSTLKDFNAACSASTSCEYDFDYNFIGRDAGFISATATAYRFVAVSSWLEAIARRRKKNRMRIHYRNIGRKSDLIYVKVGEWNGM